jgi:hypothetical protein
MGLQEIGFMYVNWIHVTTDWDELWAVVNMLINPQVRKVVELLEQISDYLTSKKDSLLLSYLTGWLIGQSVRKAQQNYVL